MPKHFHKLLLFIVIALILTGCDFLGGRGSNIFVPIPGDEQSVPPHEDQEPDNRVPITDGFDFPVGDRNGRGWAVTGYQFLDWSNASNSWHPGEDWNIPGAGNGDWGDPVYSIANGIVTFSGWNTAQGNIIQVEHHLPNGDKVWSQYAHLDHRYVQRGETVGRRQQIGTVGRGPGNRFTAHLHFEMRKEPLLSNAWPRTAGQPWVRSQVLDYWLNPTEFINQNRP